MKKLGLLVIVFLLAAPILLFIMLAVGDHWTYPLILPSKLDLSQFSLILNSSNEFGWALLNSLILSLTVGMLATTLGFWCSWNIAFHPQRVFFINLTYLPYLFAPVIYAFTLQYFFLKFDLSGRYTGLILAQLFITFPYAVILFVGYWTRSMKSMLELGQSLGGSQWQIWNMIIFPMSKNMFLFVLIQTMLISWLDYGLSSVIGLGKIPTLMLKIYQFIGESNIGVAAFGSLIVIVPVVILLILTKRYLIKFFVFSPE